MRTEPTLAAKAERGGRKSEGRGLIESRTNCELSEHGLCSSCCLSCSGRGEGKGERRRVKQSVWCAWGLTTGRRRRGRFAAVDPRRCASWMDLITHNQNLANTEQTKKSRQTERSEQQHGEAKRKEEEKEGRSVSVGQF